MFSARMSVRVGKRTRAVDIEVDDNANRAPKRGRASENGTSACRSTTPIFAAAPALGDELDNKHVDNSEEKQIVELLDAEQRQSIFHERALWNVTFGLLCVTINTTLALLAMDMLSKLRTRAYLTRPSLVPARYSPWRYLDRGQNDGSFLSVMGLTVSAFNLLHDSFVTFWNPRQERRGRPSQLGSRGALALTLHHLSSTTKQPHLCMIFGVVPSSLNATLNRALKALLNCLTVHDLAKIRWPTAAAKAGFANVIADKYPGLQSFFGVLDGTLIETEVPSDQKEQEALYSGRKKKHCINNLLLWTPDGCIAYANWNQPGAFHDMTLASRLIQALSQQYQQGQQFAVIGDVGFQAPKKPDLYKVITTPLKEAQFSRDPVESKQQTLISNLVVSARQVRSSTRLFLISQRVRLLSGEMLRLKVLGEDCWSLCRSTNASVMTF